MTFDLRLFIVTIGPLEPAFLLSLALASLVAWVSGLGLAAVTTRIRDPWRRVFYVVPLWLTLGLLLFVLPNVALRVAYPLLHPGERDATVCVACVWPAFALPTVLAYGVAVMRLRRRPTESGADGRG